MRSMQKKYIETLTILSAAFLVACSDGPNATSSNPDKSSSADMEVEFYSTLPTCDDNREGKIAYVKDQDRDYVCINNEWIENEDCDPVYSSGAFQGVSSSAERKESSSSAKSSSSSRTVKSSSSKARIVACKTDTTDNCKYGSLTDSRDGQIYKTVVIGKQIWMAENLNYEVKDSYCYNDSAEYCSRYGRLYLWSAAMDSMGRWSTNGKGCGKGFKCVPKYPVRGVCPEGWHLPTKTEYETLLKAVGGQSTAGIMLKSTSGWVKCDDCSGGTDAFAFSVLPAGDFYTMTSSGRLDYSSEGYIAGIWSSTWESRHVIYLYLNRGYDNVYLSPAEPGLFGKSVRCVKDIFSEQELSSSETRNESSGSVKSSSSSSVVKSSSSAKSSSSSVVVKSSSSIESSSSSEKSDSSSSAVLIELGTMTDSRDNQTYKTVTIGTQTWMAQNLNYESDDSRCYNDSTTYCDKYGRLYTWAAVMDSAGVWSTNGKGCGYSVTCSPISPVRGTCPEGWHVPDTTEWNTLYNTMGKEAVAMQSLGFAKWVHATNDFGFSALPAGYYGYGSFSDVGVRTYFCSASEYFSSSAYIWVLNVTNAGLGSNRKDNGCSVRCIKD